MPSELPPARRFERAHDAAGVAEHSHDAGVGRGLLAARYPVGGVLHTGLLGALLPAQHRGFV